MNDFLNDQATVNGIILIVLFYIAIGVSKISIVQDAIKDEVDSIYKQNKTKTK